MDFFRIAELESNHARDKTITIAPDFLVVPSRDILVEGGKFKAVWDEKMGLWNTSEYRVAELIDSELQAYKTSAGDRLADAKVRWARSFSSRTWLEFKKWCSNVGDNAPDMDTTLNFADTPPRKELYASKRLPYSLEDGDWSAWDELIGTLYDPEEREKIEWSIGAIISGDAVHIQKFLILYGASGTGKSTVFNIVHELFDGYDTSFQANDLVANKNAFAAGQFAGNPLVGIHHDADLSHVRDNSLLNSIVSHETVVVNEKYKAPYNAAIRAYLMVGTNKPLEISDPNSGLLRRAIDAQPSGRKVSFKRYNRLMRDISANLGAVAKHCLDVYSSKGYTYYDEYRPVRMVIRTNHVAGFFKEYADEFLSGVTGRRMYSLYKEYASEIGVEHPLRKYELLTQAESYFENYEERATLDDGTRVRAYYWGFSLDNIERSTLKPKPRQEYQIEMLDSASGLDHILADCPAQYSRKNGTPEKRWDDVTTTLSDLDTTREHYVRVPENHIVIDFDLKDDEGNKNAELNLAAASKWPRTYAEFSRGGEGVHLHYIYNGATDDLATEFEPGIEIKVYRGYASLRRRVSRCNNEPVAELPYDWPLPRKEIPLVLSEARVRSEKALRELVNRNLRKEIHPGTKPSMDFIKKILDDAYDDGLYFDIRDMRPKIMTFAMGSTNQPETCMRIFSQLHFCSKDVEEGADEEIREPENSRGEQPIVIFDVEVYPNLFVVCWKKLGDDTNVVKMLNPSPEDIEQLLGFRLVGFNNRRYDNHILYGRYLGYSNEELYKLSQRIIEKSPNAMFSEAYNASYTDIYDFSSKKQSLKKWEIELGVHHLEMDIPWDQPVDPADFERVAEYCANDVRATEVVWNHLQADWAARKILADVSGLSVNHSTNAHTQAIIFGKERHPQKDFVYTDLSTIFPGYKFEFGKSTYRGETVGEGGYVYSEPGVYYNVGLFDVASMHPTSLEELNLFGPYTKNFSEIKQARLEIKHRNLDRAKTLLGGKLEPYLADDSSDELDALSYALKIVINSVYGLTAAKFDNRCRDPRNVDNIVAKRGALFMLDLKAYLQAEGVQVIHIKTDSVKVPNVTQEIADKIMAFGKKYGYDFEWEATYDRIALVNDAVYIAHDDKGWHATGAQFQHPVVFKTLFSGEEVTLDDLSETKTVTTHMVLDNNESLPEGEHNYCFVGRAGQFVPVLPGSGGGLLLRANNQKELKPVSPGGTVKDTIFNLFGSVSGAKGFRWMERETFDNLGLTIDDVDTTYSSGLCKDAIAAIEQYADFKGFVNTAE